MFNVTINLCNPVAVTGTVTVTFSSNPGSTYSLTSTNSSFSLSNLSLETLYTGTITTESGMSTANMGLYILIQPTSATDANWYQLISINSTAATTGTFQVRLVQPYTAMVTFGYTYVQTASNPTTTGWSVQCPGYSLAGLNAFEPLTSNSKFLPQAEGYIFNLPSTISLPNDASNIRAYATVTDPATGATQTYTAGKQAPFQVLFQITDPT